MLVIKKIINTVLVNLANVKLLIKLLKKFLINVKFILLCTGKLTKACGLGGLLMAHSKELKLLFNNICKLSP
jgi:hypothetical protein